MKKDIKDYLHLYLGCDILVSWHLNRSKIGKLVTIGAKYNECDCMVRMPTNNDTSWHKLDQVKPILRPLPDMTEEEAKECELWNGWNDTKVSNREWGTIYYSPKQFQYLLSKGFDLFGLIESGLAIDKTLLNQGEGSQRSVATKD